MPIARSRGRACPTPWSRMRGPDASSRRSGPRGFGALRKNWERPACSARKRSVSEPGSCEGGVLRLSPIPIRR
eukprot:11275897-Alexandrium_andersonii.AAC.1